jgi:hypothetical protein
MSEFMRRIRKLKALTLHPDTHNGWKLSYPSSNSLINLRFNAIKITHDWRFVIWDIMPCRWQLLTHVSSNNSAPIFRVMQSKTRRRTGRHDWERAMVDWHIFRLGYISSTGWTCIFLQKSVKYTSRHGATRTRFESSATPLSEHQNTAGYVRRNNAVRTASLNQESMDATSLENTPVQCTVRCLHAFCSRR